MDTIRVDIAEDTKYHITARAVFCGHDLNVSVCGGTLHHVGAVSLAVYEPARSSATVSTVTVFAHRDDQISSYMAKELSRAIKCTVCVSAGIHIDSPSADELELLRKNCADCCAELIRRLKAQINP